MEISTIMFIPDANSNGSILVHFREGYVGTVRVVDDFVDGSEDFLEKGGVRFSRVQIDVDKEETV